MIASTLNPSLLQLSPKHRLVLEALRKFPRSSARSVVAKAGLPWTTGYTTLRSLEAIGLVMRIDIGGAVAYRSIDDEDEWSRRLARARVVMDRLLSAIRSKSIDPSSYAPDDFVDVVFVLDAVSVRPEGAV